LRTSLKEGIGAEKTPKDIGWRHDDFKEKSIMNKTWLYDDGKVLR